MTFYFLIKTLCVQRVNGSQGVLGTRSSALGSRICIIFVHVCDYDPSRGFQISKLTNRRLVIDCMIYKSIQCIKLVFYMSFTEILLSSHGN